ncbi:DUF2199 domain-containing protein [Pedobacter sp. 22226]|uniref:DUF2199 domain-containing protein n=1 Tax=Pedobacter sp. 22226 TaxID=3453894 RepID=UPI003F87046F
MEYKCSSCGEIHEEWPALTYNSPSYYNNLSENEKSTIGYLDSDFCTIDYPDGRARFIRCTLTQKVNDHCEDLEYGLWVSLSEKSFDDYSENFDNKNHEAGYFGWLSSWLPDYDFEESIPTNVNTRTGGFRPEIIPHEDFDHPFVRDYYSGISKAEAERRINEMLKAQF